MLSFKKSAFLSFATLCFCALHFVLGICWDLLERLQKQEIVVVMNLFGLCKGYLEEIAAIIWAIAKCGLRLLFYIEWMCSMSPDSFFEAGDTMLSTVRCFSDVAGIAEQLCFFLTLKWYFWSFKLYEVEFVVSDTRTVLADFPGPVKIKLKGFCKNVNQDKVHIMSENETDWKKHRSSKRDLSWIYDIKPYFPPVNAFVFTIDRVFSQYMSATPPTRRQTMAHELIRLCTLCSFPKSSGQSCIRLAQAGFYYEGNEDEVVCFSCSTTLNNWHPADVPVERHRQSSPNCAFVMGVASENKPITPTVRDLDSATDVDVLDSSTPVNNGPATGLPAADQDVSTVLNVNYPHYVEKDDRKRSFNGWSACVKVFLSMMVESGFFYVGHGDNVRCFCCGVDLYDLEEFVNPHVEHARRSPGCVYLLNLKGQGFVSFVQDISALCTQKRLPLHTHQSSESFQAAGSHNIPSLPMVIHVASVNGNNSNAGASASSQVRCINNLSNPAETSDKAVQCKQAPEVEAALQTENRKMAALMMCKVCQIKEVTIVFLPCGHLITCIKCASKSSVCMECRKKVTGTIRALTDI